MIIPKVSLAFPNNLIFLLLFIEGSGGIYGRRNSFILHKMWKQFLSFNAEGKILKEFNLRYYLKSSRFCQVF
jgi:hypothetical protein